MPFTVKRDTPFTVHGDHDGLDTTLYRCTLDGQTAADVPRDQALTGGVVSILFPNGLPKGSYTVDLFALNDLGEISDSDPNGECILTVSDKRPTTVTNVRIDVQE